jgi:hypothetical protein
LPRFLALLVCAVGLAAITAQAQKSDVSSDIAPLRFAAGTILSFDLQTRVKANVAEALDALPKGTVLRVKLLDSIDSAVNRDGFPFHGVLVSPVASGDQVIVHANAEVRGLLALLRSASHPEGFRYELLVTGLVDHGEPYRLTAFLGSEMTGGGRLTSNGPAAPSAKQAPQSGPSEIAPH